MKQLPVLHCPMGCKTTRDDFKFVEFYGPNDTPRFRCLKCDSKFNARCNSPFAGFHTDDAISIGCSKP